MLLHSFSSSAQTQKKTKIILKEIKPRKKEIKNFK